MIDTIKGYIDIKPKHYKVIRNLIVMREAKIVLNTNGYNAVLNISNFILTVKVNSEDMPYKIFFNGSLPKYYFGNNLKHLNHKTLKEAIEMFSNDVGINMKKAILTKIDYGYSFELNNPIHEYVDCLSSYPRFKTMRYDDSVTFFTKFASKKLIFYDKLIEMKSKDKNSIIHLPIEYNSKKIIRYEISLKTGLRRRFNLDTVKVSSLLKRKVINNIHNRWVNSYKKVIKVKIGIDPTNIIHHHNGLYKYLSYHGIVKLGHQRVINTISNLNFDVKSPMTKRSKLKSTVNELLKVVNRDSLDKHLIDELDHKIINFKQNEE